jgi:hypothetical protein
MEKETIEEFIKEKEFIKQNLPEIEVKIVCEVRDKDGNLK